MVEGQYGLLLIHFAASGCILTLMRFVAHRVDPFAITWIIAGTTTLLALGMSLSGPFDLTMIVGRQDPTTKLVVGAVVFFVLGSAFLASSYSRMISQRMLPSYVEGPLSRLSLLIVVGISIIFLDERRTTLGLFGITLAFVPLILSHIRLGVLSDQQSIRWAGIIWILLASVCAASMQLAAKLLIDPTFGFGVPPLVFVLATNLATALISGLVYAGRTLVSRTSSERHDFRWTLYVGTIVGFLNVIGFTSQAMFLVDGDATIIFPVSALTIVVPTLVFGLVGGERRPTKTEFGGTALAMVAIYLIVS